MDLLYNYVVSVMVNQGCHRVEEMKLHYNWYLKVTDYTLEGIDDLDMNKVLWQRDHEMLQNREAFPYYLKALSWFRCIVFQMCPFVPLVSSG